MNRPRPERPEPLEDPIPLAADLLDAFAVRTGLTGSGPPVRYLWTDAFAVCAWLGLHSATGEARFLAAARALVDQVHDVLGRHRADDPRSGWISGLSEPEGRLHPTAGGLRIGKPLPERGATEPLDPDREWERDGQYFHYLTRWMHALHRVAADTGDANVHRWAVELARAAVAGFLVGAPGGPRLVWKASIDLSRPLVPSSGHHDPLDGLVVLATLAAAPPPGADGAGLEREIAALASLCAGRDWRTADPLGAGGLLLDALGCARLADRGHGAGRLFPRVVEDAAASLRRLVDGGFPSGPPVRRLAFRELGLALGLRAVEPLGRTAAASSADAAAAMATLRRHGPVADAVLRDWAPATARALPSWSGHRDISDAMWAACLVPWGVFGD